MSLTADFDPKPMAISSIISSSASSSFSSGTSVTSPPHYQAGSSSSSAPSSPETRQHQIYHHQHHSSNGSIGITGGGVGGSIFNTVTPTCPTTPPPLSLQERRQRNKAASAKYRAKKNQQHGEMRSLIASLTKENELLLRQLDHIKRENGRLKATCDRLRGKKVAANILKRFLAAGNTSGGSNNNSISMPATDKALEQFDVDMDDEEEDELGDLMDPQQSPQH